MYAPSVAHKGGMNHIGIQSYPDGLVPWSEAAAPDFSKGRTTGRLVGCGYCGSMHPADLAAAIKAGARGHFADQKYGWPHKAYFDDIPNPHAGIKESRSSRSNPPQDEIDAGKWVQIPNGFNPATGVAQFTWTEAGSPAPSTTHGKFYLIHLQDATPFDKATIERHLGVSFEFLADGGVRWRRFEEPVVAAVPEATCEK